MQTGITGRSLSTCTLRRTPADSANISMLLHDNTSLALRLSALDACMCGKRYRTSQALYRTYKIAQWTVSLGVHGHVTAATQVHCESGFLQPLALMVDRVSDAMSAEGCALALRRSSSTTSCAASSQESATACRSTSHRHPICAELNSLPLML